MCPTATTHVSGWAGAAAWRGTSAPSPTNTENGNRNFADACEPHPVAHVRLVLSESQR